MNNLAATYAEQPHYQSHAKEDGGPCDPGANARVERFQPSTGVGRFSKPIERNMIKARWVTRAA